MTLWQSAAMQLTLSGAPVAAFVLDVAAPFGLRPLWAAGWALGYGPRVERYRQAAMWWKEQ